MKYFEMDRNEFNAKLVEMTVKELLELVKVLGFEIKGASKMKKVDLAQEIFTQWEAKVKETTTVEETQTETTEAETNETPVATAITEQQKKKYRTKALVGKIVIYNPKGEVAYTFDSYEKAMIELQVFNLSEVKWLVNGNRQPSYGPRSKFYKFNGYKFTIDKNL
ncbi:Rho termination factor N-terminal domain-containing protein [uncultured Clostridium sp.]|uniref:Rho termination factor N-terminal domain-containing protein n=1 Tax=uncultured Clostridium sp. TaxID=59620 RepID=UPI0025DFC7F8|nr:Rho termination factor N-terminal domain-containing protein [uncultured Clostridium sp.]MDU4884317.1 Rho termination factor N-terminal domain-containing protein [Clostridium celatum]MDU7077483.1 Rho termination factor N-terminal domain-containing protein [Clostridium celatum]